MKTIKITFIILILSAILILPYLSFAQIDPGLIQDAAKGAEFPDAAKTGEQLEQTIPETVGKIVSLMLSFVGALFFIFIIFSGFQWMTAGGNEEKVTQARTRLTNAAIGLAITVAAYFITWFISNTLGAA